MFRAHEWLAGASLLACVVSACIGCSAGNWPGQSMGVQAMSAEQANAPRVVVYYMHRTLRCVSCLTIEKMTRDTLTSEFGGELANGRLEFRVADYWIDTDLARQLDVKTVSVIVVNLAEGKEVSHATLDRVWELKGRPKEFRAYVVDVVRAALANATG